ncbi:MAG: hypothetical protein MUC88_18005 [Planctomycetes bacterium]|jgi:hypothetical protein|nr:hypothetical protein [Planctomycetota bacterium]
MMALIREVWRRLHAAKPPEAEPDWLPEVLKSIRWMHEEHVRDLGTLGYSPKEAFWLDFACVPFLPWNGFAHRRIELGTVFDLYADLYRLTVGPLEPVESRTFTALLRQRYHSIRQMVASADGLRHDGARIDPVGWTDSGQQKWAVAGLIVLWTARQWQQHPSAFPCRLSET